MDLSEFRQRLSMLGPDIHAWPDRDAAIALLAQSDAAVDLLAAAGDATPGPSARTTDAILDAVRGKAPE